MTYASHADLGGQPRHGAVTPEAEGDHFHAPWEPRALALTLAMGATGAWNIDMSRAARETLADYAQLTYYQIWLGALEKLLLERGLVDAAELAAGRMRKAPQPVARVLHAENVAAALAFGSPTLRPAATPARFAVGARVRMRAAPVEHHTRLPGYVRGRVGTIERVHGMHVYADAHAQGRGDAPQWLYNVAFEEAELWPDRPPQGTRVAVDAWEPYLEPA